MNILSIDAHWDKGMAYVVFKANKMSGHGKIENLNDLRVGFIDLIVTEDPYPGGNIKKYSYRGYANSFKKLCFAVGMVIQYAKTIRTEYRLIRPLDWKGFYNLTKNTSELIQKRIREQLTGFTDDEHLQDAALLGIYYIDHVMVLENANSYTQSLI
jgi:hypothetical protein